MAFETLATRKNAKLRLALTGPAGVGKTHGSLLIASKFGPRGGLMDSERGSAKKVVGLPGIPPFYHEVLEEKDLVAYIAKINEAAEAKLDWLVIDSLSHSWMAALEQVDRLGGNKFTNGWKIVSPIERRLIDTMLSFPGHLIATMRAKSAYETEKIDGKVVPRKIGMATVARDGTDFEFDVVLDLAVGGTISVSKTRCSSLDGGEFTRAEIPQIADKLRAWLDEGAPLSPADVMIDRIRFAKDEAALAPLVAEIKAMPIEFRTRVADAWKAKRKELAGVTA